MRSKAAALLHSLARNHALVDVNTIAFYGLNGVRLTLSTDAAYDLIVEVVAVGERDDVEAIARRLESATADWR